MSGSSLAMPPHQDLAERMAGDAALSTRVSPSMDHARTNGLCSSEDDFFRRFLARRAELAITGDLQRSPALGQFRVLAVLVEFTDHPATAGATYFDSLLFSASGNTVKTYYDEVSRSQIDMVTLNLPSTIGWQTAPQTYAYYVDGQQGTGDYPTNSQGLVNDVVDLIDGSIDFSPYDNDSDGRVDVLVVIHSGTGAEYSGSVNDIWSHKWGLPSPKATNDGVSVYSYTVQPELWETAGDMTIGVYCHELGHGFGLPDLYDVDNSSQGVGKWCLMSGGSWNGPLGSTPSYFSAWCRVQMGIDTVINVDANLSNEVIASVESGGPIYRMWSSGTIGSEYFLVENRQKTGFDAALPGSGLLIWHVDESAPTQNGNNAYEWYPTSGDDSQHFLVALEQADGQFELENTSAYSPAVSDIADPFPGSLGVTTFGPSSTPNTSSYLSGSTLVAVTGIATAGSDITADLIVGIAASNGDDPPVELPFTVELNQNYPNPFNPTTVIEFTISQGSDVTLEVFNVLGQKIITAVDGDLPAGTHSVSWDGADYSGDPVASGIYFYRLTAGEEEIVRKMVLVR
jgi:immune inhibitor A